MTMISEEYTYWEATLYVDNVLQGSFRNGDSRFYDLSGLKFYNGCEWGSIIIPPGTDETYIPMNFFTGYLYDFRVLNYYAEQSEVLSLVDTTTCGNTYDSSCT